MRGVTVRKNRTIDRLINKYFYRNGDFKYAPGEYAGNTTRNTRRKISNYNYRLNMARHYLSEINQEYMKKHNGLELPYYQRVSNDIYYFMGYDVPLTDILPGKSEETILYGLCFAVINTTGTEIKNMYQYSTYKYKAHLNKTDYIKLLNNYLKITGDPNTKRHKFLREWEVDLLL